jgi:hypothetical protein
VRMRQARRTIRPGIRRRIQPQFCAGGFFQKKSVRWIPTALDSRARLALSRAACRLIDFRRRFHQHGLMELIDQAIKTGEEGTKGRSDQHRGINDGGVLHSAQKPFCRVIASDKEDLPVVGSSLASTTCGGTSDFHAPFAAAKKVTVGLTFDSYILLLLLLILAASLPRDDVKNKPTVPPSAAAVW